MEALELPLSDVEANDYNPNVVPVETLNKILRDIKATLNECGTIPPIVVRPPQTEGGKYVIIDGFHRWRVFKKLKRETIPAVVMDVTEQRAKKLTANLNYLRGNYEPEKYVALLESLIADGETIEDLAATMVESEQELHELIALHGSDSVRFEAQKQLEKTDMDDKDEDGEKEHFVELKFYMAQSQADIVLRELHRIGQIIGGRNKEARALEMIAVNSSQIPTESLRR